MFWGKEFHVDLLNCKEPVVVLKTIYQQHLVSVMAGQDDSNSPKRESCLPRLPKSDLQCNKWL